MAEAQQLAQLLQSTADGNERAFAELYRSASPHLYGLLIRMLRRRDWAEEALQDCFIKIWQKADTYQASRGAPMTWLLSIARYRALDLLRAKRPEVEMPNEDDDDEIGLPPMSMQDEAEDPVARAIESEGIGKMRDCMQTLATEQRSAVMLAYYQGYTHKELSQHFKSPLGTVKSWVRRGLTRLRDCLDQ